MNLNQLGMLTAHPGAGAIAASLLVGLTFSFNPIAFAAIPVSMAYVTRGRARGQVPAFAASFIFGTIIAQAGLGFAAGASGEWVKSLLGRQWDVVLGAWLFVLGLVWSGWLHIPLPRIALRAQRPGGLIGAFLLGAPFAVAVCPACSPALVVLLGVAAGTGSAWFGAALLFAFAVGRAIPMALGAFSFSWLGSLGRVGRFSRPLAIAGGLTLMLSGLYLLNAYFFWIPSFAG